MFDFVPKAAERHLHAAIARVRAAALFALLCACSPQLAPFHGIDITGANYGQQWTLIDDSGAKRSLADYRGQLLLVYFGFTQ